MRVDGLAELVQEKVDMLNSLFQEIQAWKREHPGLCRGYAICAGGILNAYREGDLSFEAAVLEIEGLGRR